MTLRAFVRSAARTFYDYMISLFRTFVAHEPVCLCDAPTQQTLLLAQAIRLTLDGKLLFLGQLAELSWKALNSKLTSLETFCIAWMHHTRVIGKVKMR